MEKRFHCIVTSERGKSYSFALPSTLLKSTLFAIFVFVIGGIAGAFFTAENMLLRRQVAGLQSELSLALANSQEIEARALREAKSQQAQLSTTLTELKQRGQVIEEILSRVGVRLKVAESAKGAGGPFRKRPEDSYQAFTLQVDRYLDVIRSVPLGPPGQGTISSPFGYRNDPINRRPAFHSGLDIKGEHGSRILAPADGTVIAQGYTAGYGNYLELSHGNGFRTRYFHLQKALVTNGEKVQMGQTIALMGNSGRSTGTHLHYEIRYRDRLIDPLKFVQIQDSLADLSRPRAKRPS